MASYLLEGFPRSCGRENLGGVKELGLGCSPNSVTFWSGMPWLVLFCVQARFTVAFLVVECSFFLAVVAAWEFRKASSPYFFIKLGLIRCKLSGLVWIRGGSFWSFWGSFRVASLPSSYLCMYSLLGEVLFCCRYYLSLVLGSCVWMSSYLSYSFPSPVISMASKASIGSKFSLRYLSMRISSSS